MSDDNDNDDDDVALTVTFDGLSPAEAIALEEFFGRMSTYADLGATRSVAFVVDGDGSFGPEMSVETSGLSEPVPEKARAVAETANTFDPDHVAKALRTIGRGGDS